MGRWAVREKEVRITEEKKGLALKEDFWQGKGKRRNIGNFIIRSPCVRRELCIGINRRQVSRRGAEGGGQAGKVGGNIKK